MAFLTITLPCDGRAGQHGKARIIIFQTGSGCELLDVNFTTNAEHFEKHRATSGNSPVVFLYDGQPIPGDAYFKYTTNPPVTNPPNTDGSGGGIIR
jgi:hypothetical protein